MKSVWTMGELIVEIMRPRAEMPHDRADVYLGPYPSGAPAIMISAAARMGRSDGHHRRRGTGRLRLPSG